MELITKPTITIEYCPKCHWLMRAAWMAQELLTTFEQELDNVALKPSEISGRYCIFLESEIVFDRKRDGHFPEIKELKQTIRDLVAPEKSLGHSDKKEN
jgi:selenoprotein W-related protein